MQKIIMDYYSNEQFVAEVNTSNHIQKKVEKWEAHKNGILHRGFTAVLMINDTVILQHRKHPVFDGVFDLSFSSHQIYKGEILEDDHDAIFEGLHREWRVEKKDLLHPPVFKGTIHYQAKDPKSEYGEHEIDYIYTVQLQKIPQPNLDFAYGIQIVNKHMLLRHQLPPHLNLAPWVTKILESGLL